MTEKILVKNMVCHRCVLSVEDVLRRNAIPFEKVSIGEIDLPRTLEDKKREAVKNDLHAIGLEVIDDKTGGLIEKIKALVIRKARNEGSEKEQSLKLSTFLVNHLHHDYSYLSSLFSSVEGRTIEGFFIEQRIEKVKELLVYGDMNLSEIAYEMGYSSVAHLSSQFRKITGFTPSHFKKIGNERRKMIDKI